MSLLRTLDQKLANNRFLPHATKAVAILETCPLFDTTLDDTQDTLFVTLQHPIIRSLNALFCVLQDTAHSQHRQGLVSYLSTYWKIISTCNKSATRNSLTNIFQNIIIKHLLSTTANLDKHQHTIKQFTHGLLQLISQSCMDGSGVIHITPEINDIMEIPDFPCIATIDLHYIATSLSTMPPDDSAQIILMFGTNVTLDKPEINIIDILCHIPIDCLSIIFRKLPSNILAHIISNMFPQIMTPDINSITLPLAIERTAILLARFAPDLAANILQNMVDKKLIAHTVKMQIVNALLRMTNKSVQLVSTHTSGFQRTIQQPTPTQVTIKWASILLIQLPSPKDIVLSLYSPALQVAEKFTQLLTHMDEQAQTKLQYTNVTIYQILLNLIGEQATDKTLQEIGTSSFVINLCASYCFMVHNCRNQKTRDTITQTYIVEIAFRLKRIPKLVIENHGEWAQFLLLLFTHHIEQSSDVPTPIQAAVTNVLSTLNVPADVTDLQFVANALVTMHPYHAGQIVSELYLTRADNNIHILSILQLMEMSKLVSLFSELPHATSVQLISDLPISTAANILHTSPKVQSSILLNHMPAQESARLLLVMYPAEAINKDEDEELQQETTNGMALLLKVMLPDRAANILHSISTITREQYTFTTWLILIKIVNTSLLTNSEVTPHIIQSMLNTITWVSNLLVRMMHPNDIFTLLQASNIRSIIKIQIIYHNFLNYCQHAELHPQANISLNQLTDQSVITRLTSAQLATMFMYITPETVINICRPLPTETLDATTQQMQHNQFFNVSNDFRNKCGLIAQLIIERHSPPQRRTQSSRMSSASPQHSSTPATRKKRNI